MLARAKGDPVGEERMDSVRFSMFLGREVTSVQSLSESSLVHAWKASKKRCTCFTLEIITEE